MLEECAGRGWFFHTHRRNRPVEPDRNRTPNSERTAWLDLQYSFGTQSKLGELLVASGHITCPREYGMYSFC